jgi:hypothetical protein
VLDAEGAFAGLSWPDAKAVAAAVACDRIGRDDYIRASNTDIASLYQWWRANG